MNQTSETRERAHCSTWRVHEPHNWDYYQRDAGEQRVFEYRCPGIKHIEIEWGK